MEASLLAQTNHAICPEPEFLRLGIRGLDPLVTQETGNEIAHQGQAVAGTAVELPSCFQMAHKSPSVSSSEFEVWSQKNFFLT
jgi:hypothetical protein